MSYIGDIPENFDPEESFKDNYDSGRIDEWDFEERERLDNDYFPSVSPKFIKLSRKHPK